MAFFSKKNKKDKEKEKKGFFGRKRKDFIEEEAEREEKLPSLDETGEAEIDTKTESETVLETDADKPAGDIEEAISERQQAVRDEQQRRRDEAAEAAEKERAEAVALAAQAAQLAALSQEVEEAEELPDEDEEDEEHENEIESEEAAETVEEKAEEETEQEEQAEEESEQEEQEQENIKAPEKKGIFAKIREGLRKTKESMMSRIQSVLGSFTKIDEELFDELLETMIMGDMGVETSENICDALRVRIKERGITDPNEIMALIQEIISEMLGEDKSLDLSTKPSVIMVIGVNGAGKTTTIGKLCHQLKDEGKKVIVAAADTFRAAAIDQLEVWTQRSGVDIVKHAEGSDPGAVVYDAIDAAKARGCDVLICDTAGRLHNKKNLMQELAKINRIIATRAEGCSVETLLVLDATTGQNAVNQARLFKEVSDISGIVLTKLDGTAKGGIIVSIKNELDIPVKLIGVGEKIDDLQPFHAEDFVNALFEKEERL